MARKGQFKKGGGRVGHAKSHTTKRRSKSRAMTHVSRTVHVHRAAPKHHRKRRSGGSGGAGGVKLGHLALASVALGYVTNANHGVAFIRDNAAKIPGAATFGTPAAIGIAALAVDKFVKRNRWLRLLGYAGIVVAGMKLGDAGTDFKFVGDVEGDGDYDVGGDD